MAGLPLGTRQRCSSAACQQNSSMATSAITLLPHPKMPCRCKAVVRSANTSSIPSDMCRGCSPRNPYKPQRHCILWCPGFWCGVACQSSALTARSALNHPVLDHAPVPWLQCLLQLESEGEHRGLPTVPNHQATLQERVAERHAAQRLRVQTQWDGECR